jgi:hypothetical protein
MKVSQFKFLLGWVLSISLLNLAVLVVVLINLGTVKTMVKNIGGDNSGNSQLTSLKSEVSNLTTDVTQLKATSLPGSSQTTKSVCTGSLSLNLTGPIDTNYASLSNTTPIDLTCNIVQ